jgi:hypothetical protein
MQAPPRTTPSRARISAGGTTASPQLLTNRTPGDAPVPRRGARNGRREPTRTPARLLGRLRLRAGAPRRWRTAASPGLLANLTPGDAPVPGRGARNGRREPTHTSPHSLPGLKMRAERPRSQDRPLCEGSRNDRPSDGEICRSAQSPSGTPGELWELRQPICIRKQCDVRGKTLRSRRRRRHIVATGANPWWTGRGNGAAARAAAYPEEGASPTMRRGRRRSIALACPRSQRGCGLAPWRGMPPPGGGSVHDDHRTTGSCLWLRYTALWRGLRIGTGAPRRWRTTASPEVQPIPRLEMRSSASINH